MFAMPGMRTFSVSTDRTDRNVSCGPRGIFVGHIPLLELANSNGLNVYWKVRSIDQLNEELTAVFKLSIDVTAKANALAQIASALNRGDVAMAAIATVQLQFPDPLPFDCQNEREVTHRAIQLYYSQLLKADWDPTKHPRTGVPPNRGWFAPVPKEPSVPPPGWPMRHVNIAARRAFVEAEKIPRREGKYLFLGMPIVDGVLAFLDAYSPTDLNQGEDRLTAQLKAALQDPQKAFKSCNKNPSIIPSVMSGTTL